MESTCKHCDERIALIGVAWIHLRTDRRRCEMPSLAEPPTNLSALTEIPSSIYEKGFSDGRQAAQRQEQRSYNWNKQQMPLGARSVALLNEMLTHGQSDLKRIESQCESPMEELFAIAMILTSNLSLNDQTSIWQGNGIRMQCQVLIAPHRVDFVFNGRLVVEIDGHDFHDRTQEQASGDRGRDRDLLRSGFVVMRFTGADVYRNAISCADEVSDFCGEQTKADT